jgi:hypothetical protein
MTTTTRNEIRIDRTKTLADDAGTGHNRWHPDIPPLIWCDPGEDVILETLVSAFLPEDIFTSQLAG